ncbi:MAG: hypothetical protein ABI432_08070 [Flavobacteriales bacterium]
MKRLVPFLALFLPFDLLHAQALVILPGTDDPNALHFNERFIERNRVASIVGQKMIKRDNMPMQEQKEKYLYRFDEQGRPVYSNNSFGQPGSGRDTASVTYTYNEQGQLVRRLRNDLAGHFTYTTERDADGRVVRETYSRVENLGTDRYTLVPGLTTEISDEHFSYSTLNDTTWRKLYLNNLNLPYREQTFVSDHHGYLRSIEDRYLITERRSRTSFTYDHNGRLAERVEQPDLDRPRKLRHTWLYDAAGNVISGELWHDDRQMTHVEFLYEEQSMLLKARLTKDMETGQINVVRYHTTLR